MADVSDSTTEVPLSADAPLDNPAKDALGYAPFAQHIAKALVEMAPAEGFVISLHGPWGSGKTTLLNFVRYYLEQLPKEQRPIIVAFNPWWFAGSEDLVGHFFGQLDAEFRKWGPRFKKLGNKLADLGNVVAGVPLPYAGVAKAASLFRSRARSIHDARSAVERILRRQAQRIIVIVDDIDRLTADETRQMFRVIKAVANLPNITYVLAYDQRRVANALDEATVGSGVAYLEKIVQAPFDLPLPERSDIRRLFFDQLNTLIESVPDDNLDEVRWANVFFDGIDEFLDSPRAIVRLMNSLRLTFGAVKGEVDAIDFIAVESIRVFAPTLYERMRWNSKLLAGPADFSSTEAKSAAVSSLNELLQLAPDNARTAARAILSCLFPRVEAILGGIAHDAEWLGVWRKDLQIASPDVFPVYFRLQVAAGQFKAAEFKTAIALMSSERSFAELLVSLSKQIHGDNTNRAAAFLARLEDHTESDIPSDVIPNAIKGLLLAGDELLRAEPERVNFLEFGIDVQITRVAWQLLRRIQADQRYQVISAGAQEAGIAILVHWVDSLLAQHQPGRDERVRKNPILSSAETETLRATAVRRVQAAAIEGTLDRVPHLPTILARWREWGDKDEMQRWLDRRLNDPEFVALLVPQYVQHTLSMGQSDKAVRKTPRIDLKWVARAVDVNQLLVRVQGALTAEHRPDVRNAFLLYVGTATGEIKDRD